MKTVSVIVPCYNVEKYIDDCVQSLLAQTFGLDKMEFIFVDDASVDGTLAKLLEYEKRYSDTIRVIHFEENRRQGAARNAGMKCAQGEYIGFVDSDDWIEPDMYELLYNAVIERDVDYAICSRYNDYPDNTSDIQGPQEDGILSLEGEEFKNWICGKLAPGGVVQRLYKKEVLDKMQLWFPEGLAYEDNYFNGISTYYINSVGLVKKPLYHYRINQTSTTQSKNAKHHLDRLTIEVMKVEALKERGLFEQYREDIEMEFLRLYFLNTLNILFGRFGKIPDGVIKAIQEKTRELFPKWYDNILLNNFETKETQIRCRLIEYPFAVGDKEELLRAIKQVAEVEQLYSNISALIQRAQQGENIIEQVAAVQAIYQNNADAKKLVTCLVKRMQQNLQQCITCLSYLYEITKDADIVHVILECIKDEQIDCLTMENIREQMAYYLFTKTEIRKLTYQEEREQHRILLDKWEREYGAIAEYIPVEERNQNTILIATNQFLSLKHAPTEIVAETISILKQAGFEVYLLINYTHFSSEHLSSFLCDYSITQTNEDLNGRGILKYGELEIPYMQVNYSYHTEQVIKVVGEYIEEIKPELIWQIGGYSFIADIIGRCSTMIATRCTDGYAVSEAPILASYMCSDSDYIKESLAYIEQRKQQIGSFVSPITGGYEKKGIHYTRIMLGLPEDKYLICLVGNRLNNEVNADFSKWMEAVVDASEEFLFVTIGDGDKIWKNSEYQNKIIHLGYQDNLTDVLTCMDVFVNPPRQGGGGGAISAMAAGIPAFTLGDCDVANGVAEDFIVKSLEEMKELTIRCYEDKVFYASMCEKARQKYEEHMRQYKNGEVQQSIFGVVSQARELVAEGKIQ